MQGLCGFLKELGCRAPIWCSCRSAERENLTGASRSDFSNLVHPPPLSGNNKKRATIRSTECAGETAAINFDGQENLASFAHSHAPFVGDVRIPDGPLGV